MTIEEISVRRLKAKRDGVRHEYLHKNVFREGILLADLGEGAKAIGGHVTSLPLALANLEPSMSRRETCHDNAVAESFFQLLTRERIRRWTYPTRDTAQRDMFEYIELFYNPERKHTNNRMLSPVDFESRQQKLAEAGV